MLVELPDPQATYFSLQTYTHGWFAPGDYANRQTSLNNTQLLADSDNVYRIVLSAQDPGVANWIDTEGRSRGLLVYRYMQALTPETPSVQLLSLDELSERLPSDTARVDESERRAAISIRQKHIQHRFHN